MKIIVFGDVMAGRNVARSLESGVDLLQGMHINTEDTIYKICNLEAPLVQNRAYSTNKLFATDVAITLIQQFKAVTLANNHIFDQGLDGMFDTITMLDKWNISHTGVGTNKEEAFMPIIVEENDRSIALLGISSLKNFLAIDQKFFNHIALIEDEDLLKSFVRQYKQKSNILIVMPHMGVEHVDCPPDNIKKAYRNLLDIGFDMVIASHPHAIQGVEMYSNKLICYSLGDFIFDNLSKLRQTAMHLVLEFSSDVKPTVKYCITRKNSLLQPFNMSERYVMKTLTRLNRYVSNRYAYYFRYLICKTSNQIYSISYAIRTRGVQGAYATIKQKIKLLCRR